MEQKSNKNFEKSPPSFQNRSKSYHVYIDGQINFLLGKHQDTSESYQLSVINHMTTIIDYRHLPHMIKNEKEKDMLKILKSKIKKDNSFGNVSKSFEQMKELFNFINK
jgi:hypothetical protein